MCTRAPSWEAGDELVLEYREVLEKIECLKSQRMVRVLCTDSCRCMKASGCEVLDGGMVAVKSCVNYPNRLAEAANQDDGSSLPSRHRVLVVLNFEIPERQVQSKVTSMQLKSLQLQLPILQHLDCLPSHISVIICFSNDDVVVFHFPEDHGVRTAERNADDVAFFDSFGG